MNDLSPPNAEEQLAFLRSLQRLLDEGIFTSSYKFALLHAIANLCVAKGDDSGAGLKLSTEAIAEQFIRLYWRQVQPFPGATDDPILSQTTGRQAAIVRQVAEQRAHYGSLAELKKSSADWEKIRRQVEVTIKKMPLWKLQTVGSERLVFLYENVDSGHLVPLKPGVAYCFRVLYPLVINMIEGAWSHFVERRNPELLGQLVDLRSFLFGTARRSLESYRPLLRELQQGRCFYCERHMRSGRENVDHFIPWRRFPLDLGHNFVLADQGCNESKRDLLAAEPHLLRWVERNYDHEYELQTGFDKKRMPYDLPTTYRIARWAYGQGGGPGLLDSSRAEIRCTPVE